MHLTLDTLFLTCKPKIYTEEKKAFSTYSAGISEWWHVEECKYNHIYHPAKPQVQVDRDINIHPVTLNPIEQKVGNRLEHIGT